MLPAIVMVGRPNVGKSTLFNRVTRSRDALVANIPGLTRDRKYGEAELDGRTCLVVDTGGLAGEDDAIDEAMAAQAIVAVDEADVCLFLVDARQGLTAGDQEIAGLLRRHDCAVVLVINKMDGVDEDLATAEFAALGFENAHVSATHGTGMDTLLEAVTPLLPAPEETVETSGHGGISVAVIGRPNVGKSTLINRMLGEERLVVFDEPGTTRDSIDIPLTRKGRHYTLIDTAGVRRRGRTTGVVEKFSVVKTLDAIHRADVVVLLLDAREGIVEQDLHLLGYAVDAGRGLVIAANKWDGLDVAQKERAKREFDRRLNFVPWVRLLQISALHGTGVGHLFEAIQESHRAAEVTAPTAELSRILEVAVEKHQPPLVRGRRIKLRYAHLGGAHPPTIILHGNQIDSIPASYRRYLENVFREHLNVFGTPVRVEFRGSNNPFAGRRNPLTPRQERRRKRVIRHSKARKRR